MLLASELRAISNFDVFVREQIRVEGLAAEFKIHRIERMELDDSYRYFADVESDLTLSWLDNLASIASDHASGVIVRFADYTGLPS